MKQRINKIKQNHLAQQLVLVVFFILFGVVGVKLLIPSYAALPVPSTGWYVSPSGTATGNGSKENPWDLTTAFKFPTSVKPGDTIWLRGGKYGTGSGTVFTSNIVGTAAAPIKVRQYPNERATVDGGIVANGAYTWFWGFEITNTSPNRRVTNNLRPPGINMFGPGTKAINMVIHDVGHPGIGFWNNVGDGGEIYGTLLWGNGLYDMGDPRFPNGWTRGSPIYAQNQVGNRYIKENFTFRNFTSGMKAYTQGGYANGFTFEGNIVFDAVERGIFVAADTNPINFVNITNNYLYERAQESGGGIKLGYFGSLQGQATVTGNYAIGRRYTNGESTPIDIENWRSSTLSGNTLIGEWPVVWFRSNSTLSTYQSNQNTLYGPLDNFRQTAPGSPPQMMTFAQWNTRGYDTQSQFVKAMPTQNKVFVRKNAYEDNRGNITIYNWEKLPSVTVNLGGVLAVGVPYEVRDAQNFYGTPVASGTYQGGSINIPMNLSQVAPLTGDVTTINNVHTAPEFAAFVVIPTGTVLSGQTVVAPPPPTPSGPPPATNVSPEIEEASIQTEVKTAQTAANKAAAVASPTTTTESVDQNTTTDSSPLATDSVPEIVDTAKANSTITKRSSKSWPKLLVGIIAVVGASFLSVLTVRRHIAHRASKKQWGHSKSTPVEPSIIKPTKPD